jgi:hypothetical protein
METSALMGMNVAQLIIDDYLEVMGELKLQDLAGSGARKGGSEEL